MLFVGTLNVGPKKKPLVLEFWVTIGNNQPTAAVGSLWFGIEIWEDLEEPRLWRD